MYLRGLSESTVDATYVSLEPRYPQLPHAIEAYRGGEFFIDNLLVRIHFIIEMIWWTGLAPWEF